MGYKGKFEITEEEKIEKKKNEKEAKKEEKEKRKKEKAEEKARRKKEKPTDAEKEAKREERKEKRKENVEKVKKLWSNVWVRVTAIILAVVLLLTGGHFLGKGIAKSIRNKNSNKPSTSQTDPTNSNEPTIDISQDKDNIVNYDEIYSTENFENVVTNFVKPYVTNKLSLTTEDLLKFASIVNIDRLAEENPELAKELFGSQTAEEYLNDAAKTIGVTYMHNHLAWEKDKNTNNFIWISNSIPEGDSQKEKMVELESYVTKIAKAAAEENKDEVNKLTLELIESLTLPDGSLNALDDGVEFGAQLYFALINNSIARNYLNQEYRDYFTVISSAEQNVSNIFTVYNKCITDTKVRTK